jgi:hypothetical protein
MSFVVDTPRDPSTAKSPDDRQGARLANSRDRAEHERSAAPRPTCAGVACGEHLAE